MLTARWDCPGCNQAFTDAEELARLPALPDSPLFHGLCHACHDRLEEEEAGALFAAALSARLVRAPDRYARPAEFWAVPLQDRLPWAWLAIETGHPSLALAHQTMLLTECDAPTSARLLNAMRVPPPALADQPRVLAWHPDSPVLADIARWYSGPPWPASASSSGPGAPTLGIWVSSIAGIHQAARVLEAHADWRIIGVLHPDICSIDIDCYASPAGFDNGFLWSPWHERTGPVGWLEPLLWIDRLVVITHALDPADKALATDGDWHGETARIVWCAHLLGVETRWITPDGRVDTAPHERLHGSGVALRIASMLDDGRGRFRRRRSPHVRVDMPGACPELVDGDEVLGWEELIAALPLDVVRRFARSPGCFEASELAPYVEAVVAAVGPTVTVTSHFAWIDWDAEASPS